MSNRAVLMVRIGMAYNALQAQLHAAEGAKHARSALRLSRSLGGLVQAAAVVHESIRLAGEGMATLRELAQRAGAAPELLTRLGQLCAGKHSSKLILIRARNQLGFHWD